MATFTAIHEARLREYKVIYEERLRGYSGVNVEDKLAFTINHCQELYEINDALHRTFIDSEPERTWKNRQMTIDHGLLHDMCRFKLSPFQDEAECALIDALCEADSTSVNVDHFFTRDILVHSMWGGEYHTYSDFYVPISYQKRCDLTLSMKEYLQSDSRNRNRHTRNPLPRVLRRSAAARKIQAAWLRFSRRLAAARVIQTAYLRATYNPRYSMCRVRVMNEFDELVAM
jgi:hypothetical protein